MRADEVTVVKSLRGRPKDLTKTKAMQLTDSNDLFSLGINLSSSIPIAVTPPRISKWHKNVTIMADEDSAVIVPVRRRKRSAHVSIVNPTSCVDHVLIDTTNFSREPECMHYKKPLF